MYNVGRTNKDESWWALTQLLLAFDRQLSSTLNWFKLSWEFVRVSPSIMTSITGQRSSTLAHPRMLERRAWELTVHASHTSSTLILVWPGLNRGRRRQRRDEKACCIETESRVDGLGIFHSAIGNCNSRVDSPNRYSRKLDFSRQISILKVLSKRFCEPVRYNCKRGCQRSETSRFVRKCYTTYEDEISAKWAGTPPYMPNLLNLIASLRYVL